jgi:hypothetical protein
MLPSVNGDELFNARLSCLILTDNTAVFITNYTGYFLKMRHITIVKTDIILMRWAGPFTTILSTGWRGFCAGLSILPALSLTEVDGGVLAVLCEPIRQNYRC